MISWCIACRANVAIPELGTCAPCTLGLGEEIPPAPAPYYERDGVSLYLGLCHEITPYFTEAGICMWDPPYSAHTHSKSRTGARATPLLDGNGRLSPCAISRAVDFGFASLAAEERRAQAREAARLSSRWTATFSDERGDWKWRISLMAAGLEYVRTAVWEKIGSTPQFTGDRPAVAVESIILCHPHGRKHWNGGGKRGIYKHNTVIDRGDRDEARGNETQKPETLMIELVEDFTDAGELVYDFTCGFATTAIGCRRAKGGPRRFVGIEKREEQIEKAARRLDAELSGSTYTAASVGQLPLLGGV